MNNICEIIDNLTYDYVRKNHYSPTYLILSLDNIEKLLAYMHQNGLMNYSNLHSEETYRGMKIVIKKACENFIDVAGGLK